MDPSWLLGITTLAQQKYINSIALSAYVGD